jgi:hypothetical protein
VDAAAQAVTVRLSPDEEAYGYNDVLRVVESPALGSLDTGRDDLCGFRLNPVDHATFPASTVVMSTDGRNLALTLGGGDTNKTAAADGRRMVWWPGSTVCPVTPACAVTESGVTLSDQPDRDF